MPPKPSSVCFRSRAKGCNINTPPDFSQLGGLSCKMSRLIEQCSNPPLSQKGKLPQCSRTEQACPHGESKQEKNYPREQCLITGSRKEPLFYCQSSNVEQLRTHCPQDKILNGQVSMVSFYHFPFACTPHHTSTMFLPPPSSSYPQKLRPRAFLQSIPPCTVLEIANSARRQIQIKVIQPKEVLSDSSHQSEVETKVEI